MMQNRAMVAAPDTTLAAFVYDADTHAPMKPVSYDEYGDQVTSDVRRKVVLAALAGNFVEWYEFAAYGVVAAFIAHAFFASHDPFAALLGVYAVFGLAFVARPIGGIIISRYGDTVGRKKVMAWCIIAMSAATVGIGILPTYAAIGVAAPILLLLLRLIQGAAAGGEWSSAVSFVFEHSPSRQRARWISYLAASTYPGLLGGAGLAAVLALTMGSQAFEEWGWRILFLLAAPLGLIGVYVRRRVDESPAFEAVRRGEQKLGLVESPMREAFRNYRQPMFALFLITITYMTGIYTNSALYVTYLVQHGFSSSDALNSTLVGLVILTLGVLLFGPLSDRFGRKPVIILGNVMMAATIIPMFWLPLHFGTVWSAMLGTGMFTLAIALIGVPVLTSLPELFPPHIRATAGSLPYNMATILAGFGPYIAVTLNKNTGDPLSYPYYVIILAAISIFGSVFIYKDPTAVDN
ncbi:Major facilitator superfamily protein [Brucella sp. BO2]|uniref:MFS transporter n=1 Tax=Brucella sp. BO2 TaxID=693750 RepID=UPI0001E443A6|nr:MFS transporter [Brucella sp. BO2]EFM60189.1 Major facilitator superfamily protein [Brucella sp. BO2]QPN28435.1 MFS transporter [Brucella sp. BO2]